MWIKAVENKIASKVAIVLSPHHALVVWLSRLVNVGALTVLGFWIAGSPISVFGNTIEQEPLLVGLSLLATALNQTHRWLLRESEYSPAYALAMGYVTNFLSPVLTQLIEKGETNPIIYVYRPKNFAELYDNNLDRVKAEIRNKDFKIKEVNLNPKQARSRDVMVVQKSKNSQVYFDFPSTLRSLAPYVDYKVKSDENSSADKEKQQLTNQLIDKFFEKVDSLLERDDFTKNVKYCDRDLEIEVDQN